jgi:hypothetical protein
MPKIEFTQEQIKAMAERAITILFTIFLAKLVRMGWLSDSDSAMLLPFLVILPSLAYAWWVNTDKSLVQSASNVPGTVVVTTKHLAESTPQTNIVSSTTSRVVTEAEVVTEPGEVVQQPSKEPLK